MNVLVTGGAGFIGSHLVEGLMQAGHSVQVLDNLSTGSLENLAHLRGSGQLDFVKGDIRDTALVRLLVSRCDLIYHLAAAVGVQLITEDPVRTIATNIGGTEVVLEMANTFGRPVFIASTSEVYGKSEAVPFHEDDDFLLGSTAFSRWSYACSKAVDEFLAQAYYEQYGLCVVVGRFFNTIGPRQSGRYGMVVPRFVQWALKGEPIRIYGTGQQTRCFCYVKDLVGALKDLMDGDRAAGRVFNLGSNHEITIETLADRILALTGSSSPKTFVPYAQAYGRPIEDMKRRVPCTQRIQQAIQWQPTTGLDEMLRIIIEYEKGTR